MTSLLRGTTLMVLFLFLLSACSSTPAIPDEDETITYRSAEGDKDEKKTTDSPVVTQTKPPTDPGMGRAQGPVATVDGVPVTAAEYNEALDRLLASGRVPPQMNTRIPELLTKQLVTRKLIFNKLKTANIQVTDAQLDARIKTLRADFERTQKLSDSKMTFEQAMGAMGMDPKDYKKTIREGLSFEALLKKEAGYAEITPDEAKTFYDQNPNQFKQPEQIRASHILIKAAGDEKAWAEAKTRADKVRALAVAKDADFATLATEHSEGPSKTKGGDLGFFPRKAMVPEFETAVFALKVDEVSEPVRTQFGWHVIKKTAERKARTLPFEEIGEPLRRKLNQQKFQGAMMGYVQKLSGEAKIEMTLENIK